MDCAQELKTLPVHATQDRTENMPETQQQETNRREWLAACVRWASTAVLLVTSVVLIRRRLRSGCVDERLACAQCGQNTACGLPRAVDYRVSTRK
jgi:hypothetical protein